MTEVKETVFDRLGKRVRDAIVELGYSTPTPIQEKPEAETGSPRFAPFA